MGIAVESAVMRLKCFACHEGKGIETPAMASAPIRREDEGCLSREAKIRIPLSFPLSAEERDALVAYVRLKKQSFDSKRTVRDR